jgi:hypothetical protein
MASQLSRRAGLPALDRYALISADIVFLNASGAMAYRLRDALTAYLYTVDNIRHGEYPSDAEVAAVVARARAERTR